jgi:hypothetical protein
MKKCLNLFFLYFIKYKIFELRLHFKKSKNGSFIKENSMNLRKYKMIFTPFDEQFNSTKTLLEQFLYISSHFSLIVKSKSIAKNFNFEWTSGAKPDFNPPWPMKLNYMYITTVQMLYRRESTYAVMIMS